MSKKTTWLIYHKVSIGERSSLNMDSSSVLYVIAAVPEQELEKALVLLKDDLTKNDMVLLEVYKCLRTDIAQMPGEIDLQKNTDHVIRIAESRDVVSMTAIGNETLEGD